MRLQSRSGALFQLSLAVALILQLIVGRSSTLQAQSVYANQLNFGQWQATTPTVSMRSAAPTARATTQPEVRQVNFQSPGEVGLPPLPGAVPAPLPDLGMPAGSMPMAAGSLSDGPVLPPTTVPGGFNQFSNPGGAMSATEVQPAGGSGLRSVTHPSQLPPLNNGQANSGQAVSGPLNNGQMAGQGYAQPGYRQAVFNQNGGQYVGGQVNPYSQGQVLPPGSLRSQAQPGYGQPAYGQPGQLAVVSQDPRFISPPVRTGNYATAPYRAPLRTISYQTGPQGMVAQAPTQVPTQQVLPPQTIASQPPPSTVANTTSLPQFQPTVGAQLTSYQTGYQAGQYCGPGVPAVVPGAVVPPTLTPNLAPQMYSPDNAGFKPLFSLGQENYNVLLGRGIVGQPTAYVPGQPIRNFMRYIFP